jgi:hypothetical protein
MAGGISTRRMSADCMSISHGVTRLTAIRDGKASEGGPELVTWGEHRVISMPVLPWRRSAFRSGSPVTGRCRSLTGNGTATSPAMQQLSQHRHGSGRPPWEAACACCRPTNGRESDLWGHA